MIGAPVPVNVNFCLVSDDRQGAGEGPGLHQRYLALPAMDQGQQSRKHPGHHRTLRRLDLARCQSARDRRAQGVADWNGLITPYPTLAARRSGTASSPGSRSRSSWKSRRRQVPQGGACQIPRLRTRSLPHRDRQASQDLPRRRPRGFSGRRRLFPHQRRRVRRSARPLGLRQEHHPEHGGDSDHAEWRRHPRRRLSRRVRPADPQRRLRLPEDTLFPVAHRRGQHRLRARAGRRSRPSSAARASPRRSTRPVSTASGASIRPRCRAACASACR